MSPEEWQRFGEWVQCVCVVTFDLEVGQALEEMFPGGALSGRERSDLCYLAFPDSNSNCMGDTRFHVRLRALGPPSETHRRYNAAAPLATLRADATHYWGFVHFRQVRDPGLPRGYLQKSVVVLTRLPFVDFMYKLTARLAPRFFRDGAVALDEACREIGRWPCLRSALSPPRTLLLPLFGERFALTLSDDPPSPPPLHPAALPAYPRDVRSYSSLSSALSDLHLLWELALTAEPIVVTASSPTACSAMVQALVDLIRPLQYCADYRPYFTIHDSEFKEFTKKRYNPPYVILGVTNPFFTKTLQHWPHVVKLDEPASFGSKLRKPSASAAAVVKTQYRPYLAKDKTILRRLTVGSLKSERSSEIQESLVRRHVLELTQSFMIPLERYMASLMPLQKNVSAFRAAPSPRPFNPEDFMNMLQQAGPHLTSGIKGDWAGLYRAFLKSPNFSGWFQRRYSELAHALQALQLEALAATDLAGWAAGRQEVELVDMVLKLRKTMASNDEANLPLKGDTMTLLAQKLNDITRILPDDLKSILQNNT